MLIAHCSSLMGKAPGKRWFCLHLLAIIGFANLFCVSWVAAQPEIVPLATGSEINPSLSGMDKTVSLDLRSADATDALKFIASQGNLNIAISKSVSGRVNLFLTDVPIRDVFDLILRSNELAYDKQGNVYHVMTETEYRNLYGKRFSDVRQVRTFRLQYAVPQQAFNLMDTLKSEIGRLLVDEESGTVMVMDTPEKLRQMESALAVLEKADNTKVIDLSYATAADVEESLRDQLEINKLGFIKADERSNQIIIKTLPERMKQIENLISALDRKTREVLIDAKIVKVTYDHGKDNGIDWNKVFTNLKFHGLQRTDGNFRSDTTGTAPSDVPGVQSAAIPAIKIRGRDGESIKLGELLFGTTSAEGYELFRYLETLGETKIISNPRLMVTENEPAKIHVGTKEAYVTTTTTTGQTTSTTAEDIEFIDVGIQLDVTPSINREGFVTMKIVPEVSSVVRQLTTPSGNEIPIVDTSTAETRVMVKDGATVVLGGLRKDQKTFTNRRVPYLAHVPVMGKLFFRQIDSDNQLTELVVFITPHVVDGEEFVTGDEGGKVRGYREYTPVLSGSPSKLRMDGS